MSQRLLPVLLVALGSCHAEDPVDTDAAPVEEDPAPVYDCASSELTWDSWADGFFTTWCTPCHSGTVTGEMRKGAPLRADFDDYAAVAYFLPAIAIAVAQEDPLDPYPPRMPPGGGVPAATKDLLAEWMACGAPEGAPPVVDACDVVSVVPGDLVVDAQSTADAFCAAGNAVGGDLILSAAGEIAIDCLCEVQGDVSVVGPTTAVDLPALVAVAGSVLVSSTESLTTFSANALTAV
ncbi:MAG: hypothetical protein H0V89_12620, partial [Deltaproteobacteria bacterium]|nr:hypothetical protein [Deltaproteobacteria bacterium]